MEKKDGQESKISSEVIRKLNFGQDDRIANIFCNRPIAPAFENL